MEEALPVEFGELKEKLRSLGAVKTDPVVLRSIFLGGSAAQPVMA